MEHKASDYECVKKYDILNGYLEHFKEVSKNNEIPGLISFFYILGQASDTLCKNTSRRQQP